MANERIKLHMSVKDVIIAMAGRNPGALTACMALVERGGIIDPDDAMGGLANLLDLDNLNIWDERIYLLWNDVCGRDLAKMIAVLRAYQLGQLAGATKEAIDHAIDHRGAGLDMDAIMAAIKERLPNFNPATAAVH